MLFEREAIETSEVVQGSKVRPYDYEHSYYGQGDRLVHVQADPLRAGEKTLWLTIGRPVSRAMVMLQRSQGIHDGNEESVMKERGEPFGTPYSAEAVAELVVETFNANKRPGYV